jgi:hypothetical protein
MILFALSALSWFAIALCIFPCSLKWTQAQVETIRKTAKANFHEGIDVTRLVVREAYERRKKEREGRERAAAASKADGAKAKVGTETRDVEGMPVEEAEAAKAEEFQVEQEEKQPVEEPVLFSSSGSPLSLMLGHPLWSARHYSLLSSFPRYTLLICTPNDMIPLMIAFAKDLKRLTFLHMRPGEGWWWWQKRIADAMVIKRSNAKRVRKKEAMWLEANEKQTRNKSIGNHRKGMEVWGRSRCGSYQ